MNSIMKGWKYRSRELLKTYFCHQSNIKKVNRLHIKFSLAPKPDTSMQRCFYVLFQNQWSFFFKEYLHPQVGISKMVNKHTVDYQPSPLGLTSNIHPLIFLWTLEGFISPFTLMTKISKAQKKISLIKIFKMYCQEMWF